MTSEVIYLGDLRTQATHLRSGQQIITDAPLDNNGKGEAFSPTDLAATSLAACMMTIMGIAARQHDIDIVGTKAEIHKIMATDLPRRIAKIEIRLLMPDRVYSEKEKKILTKASQNCPVKLSIHPDIVEELTIVWGTVEEEGL